MKKRMRVFCICDHALNEMLIRAAFENSSTVEVVTARIEEAAKAALFEPELSKALFCGSMTRPENVGILKFIADTLIAGGVTCAGTSSSVGLVKPVFERFGVNKVFHLNWQNVKGWISDPIRIQLPV